MANTAGAISNNGLNFPSPDIKAIDSFTHIEFSLSLVLITYIQ